MKIPLSKIAELLVERCELVQSEADNLTRNIVGVFQLDDLEPEDLFVVGRRAWFGGGVIPAAVGFRSQGGVFNEGGSTTADVGVVLVRGAYLSAPANSTFLVRYSSTPSSFQLSGVITFLRDGQFFPGQAPVAQPRQAFCRGQNTLAAQGTIGPPVSRVIANTPLLVPWWEILGPSQGILFDPSADNAEMTGSFWGEEWDLRIR